MRIFLATLITLMLLIPPLLHAKTTDSTKVANNSIILKQTEIKKRNPGAALLFFGLSAASFYYGWTQLDVYMGSGSEQDDCVRTGKTYTECEELYPADTDALTMGIAAAAVGAVFFGLGLNVLESKTVYTLSNSKSLRIGVLPVRRGALAAASLRF